MVIYVTFQQDRVASARTDSRRCFRIYLVWATCRSPRAASYTEIRLADKTPRSLVHTQAKKKNVNQNPVRHVIILLFHTGSTLLGVFNTSLDVEKKNELHSLSVFRMIRTDTFF